jgi:hypothetical protein
MERGAGVICFSTGTVFPNNNISSARKTSFNPTDYFRNDTSGTARASHDGAKEVETPSATAICYGNHDSTDPTTAG